jgi:hypothetical protein
MAAMTPAEFATVVRRELKARDAARKTRLFDQATWDAADSAFIKAITAAIGLEAPEPVEKTVAKGRQARAKNEAAAFGKAG